MLKRLLLVCLTTLGLFALLNIYAWTRENKPVDVVPGVAESIVLPRTETITLTAAGDCLMHNTQIWSGWQKDGTYCFDSFFTDVKDLIAEGDYSSTNFEAAMAGAESGYTGYPAFNSPDVMADAFKNAGFDLVVTTNNHIMDRGYNGAVRTMEVLRGAGLDTVGTNKDEEESRSFLIKDIKGVKVAYLAYTYGTNGIPVPKKHSYLVNLLEREKVLADIKAIRPQADVLILVLHWGVEYSPHSSREQKTMAYEFLEAGADVILGSHPHVIQDMEIIRAGKKDKFVVYSMGNFISDQKGLERNSGIVLKMKFTKNFNTGETLLAEASYTPTYSHSYYINGNRQFRVVPVEATISKILAEKEPYLNRQHLPILQEVLNTTRSKLGKGVTRVSVEPSP